MNNRTIVDDIVWFIPNRKLRDKLRVYLNKKIYNNFFNISYIHNNVHQVIAPIIRKMTPKTSIEHIDIHIVEHCNMSCYSCLHYGQLAEEEYLELEEFKKDIEKLYRITNGNIGAIQLLGGEPLLNKNIKEYFYIARSYFKDSIIRLTTNGILLTKQNEDFWRSCKDNNIVIKVSRYLINLDWKKMEDIAKEYSVDLEFTNEEFTRNNYKWVFDENKQQESFASFINCFLSNGGCTTLKNGKIYMCCISAHIEHFNKYFNKNLEVTPLDYIELDKVKDYREILNFLSNPIPFCSYCDISKLSMTKWKPSSKDISEYMISDKK